MLVTLGQEMVRPALGGQTFTAFCQITTRVDRTNSKVGHICRGGCQTYCLIYNYQPCYCNIYKARFQDFLIGTLACVDVKLLKAHKSLRRLFIQEQGGQRTNIG